MKIQKTILILFALAIIAGCSPKQYSVQTEVYEYTPVEMADASHGIPRAAVQRISLNETHVEPSTERKVVHSAILTMEVGNTDTAEARLALIAEKYNGYVSQSGTHRVVIRVVAAHFRDALTDIEKTGNVQSRSTSGRDITDQYWDHAIRLENATKARDRYLELLAQAETVEAALKVEIELERLNKEIDRLKGQLNRMEHLLEYSTITINLREKVKPGIIGYIGIGLYRSVRWLFVRN